MMYAKCRMRNDEFMIASVIRVAVPFIIHHSSFIIF